MEYTSYKDALSFWQAPNEKIKVVVFALADCPTCDDFLPDLFLPKIEERAEHFEVVFVDMQTSTDMPFPPVATPTSYFYIPNTEEPMPLFRVGGTTPQILENDLDSMIRIKDEGKTVSEAFFSTPLAEVTSWVQRGLSM